MRPLAYPLAASAPICTPLSTIGNLRGRIHVYELAYDSVYIFVHDLHSNQIALGRLSPAKAANTFFTLICPKFYRPDSQSHLAAQSANSCDLVSFCLPAPTRGRQKIRGNILTMLANCAEKTTVYKLIISINKYKLTAIILN
jgi:hypothetical protein